MHFTTGTIVVVLVENWADFRYNSFFLVLYLAHFLHYLGLLNWRCMGAFDSELGSVRSSISVRFHLYLTRHYSKHYSDPLY